MDLAEFWFGFSVFALENCVFLVLVSNAVCRFSPIWSFDFVNNNGGFSDFSVQCFILFFFQVLSWKLHPGVTLNCNSKGPLISFLLQFPLEECMTSLVSLAAVITIF